MQFHYILTNIKYFWLLYLNAFPENIKNSFNIFYLIVTEDVSYSYKESFGEGNYLKELDKLINVTIPTYLERFDGIVAKNNGYFVNGKLTWVDLYFVSLADYFQGLFNWTELKFDGNFVDKYENLKSLKEKVLAIESIKNWVDKRPDTIA